MSDLRFFLVLKLRIITQHHQKVIRVKMKQMYEQSYNKVYWHCYREGKKLKNTLHTYIIIHFPKLMAGMEIPFINFRNGNEKIHSRLTGTDSGWYSREWRETGNDK